MLNAMNEPKDYTTQRIYRNTLMCLTALKTHPRDTTDMLINKALNRITLLESQNKSLKLRLKRLTDGGKQ